MKNMQRWLNSKGRDLEVAMFNTIGLNDEKINVLYAVSLFITDELGFAGVYNNDQRPGYYRRGSQPLLYHFKCL